MNSLINWKWVIAPIGCWLMLASGTANAIECGQLDSVIAGCEAGGCTAFPPPFGETTDGTYVGLLDMGERTVPFALELESGPLSTLVITQYTRQNGFWVLSRKRLQTYWSAFPAVALGPWAGGGSVAAILGEGGLALEIYDEDTCLPSISGNFDKGSICQMYNRQDRCEAAPDQCAWNGKGCSAPVGGECDAGYQEAFVFTQGGGTPPLPVGANGSAWVAFNNSFPNHQLYASNGSPGVDLIMEVWYPGSEVGCPPATYTHDEVGEGPTSEIHNTDSVDVDPIPNGMVYIRVTNKLPSSGTFTVFDSD